MTSQTERQIQTYWAQVLKIGSIAIGLVDSLFKLGGDSITATKLVGEAHKAGITLAVADNFRRGTLAELARKESHPLCWPGCPYQELLAPSNRLQVATAL